jgi:dedicator of cytokinesis protein 3
MNIGKCGRFTRPTSSLTGPCSAINYFSSPRPIIKVDRDGNEETWVEKTYYTTEESFPAVLRRSEVVAVEIVELSPVENALLEVEQKNKELNALNMKYSSLAKTAQVVSTNPLSMALNGVVDTPAGGGIASYRSSFLTHNYIARHLERKEFVDKLRAAVDEQVRVMLPFC